MRSLRVRNAAAQRAWPVRDGSRSETSMLDEVRGHSSWTWLIDDIIAGRWRDPETGRAAEVSYKSVVIATDLDGAEADLVRPLELGSRLAVVSDPRTRAAMGARIEKALASIASVEPVILDDPHADEATVEELRQATRGFDGLVAVGSGTINDLCKYVTFLDGRPYCVFGTAASMNGYTSTTASINLSSGLKVSKKAHAPRGVFLDLKVNAAAPPYLAAAGFGDFLCRSTAQVDWWLSHRLLDTYYTDMPFAIQREDEKQLLARAKGIATGDIEAIGYLQRIHTLCGLGVSFTGMTNHGSMGEHQISHYVDCFAGDRHPGSRHGQQVGIASLTIARLQHAMLASETPPVLRPTGVDEAAMLSRYGAAMAPACIEEFRKKALDAKATEAMNRRLAAIWPDLRRELQAFMLPVETMSAALAGAGGAITATQLGLDVPFYREAVLYAREIRNRYSMLDLADDAGLLADFVEGEV